MTSTQDVWSVACMRIVEHQETCSLCRDIRRCPTRLELRVAEIEAWNDDRQARGLERLALPRTVEAVA